MHRRLKNFKHPWRLPFAAKQVLTLHVLSYIHAYVLLFIEAYLKLSSPHFTEKITLLIHKFPK